MAANVLNSPQATQMSVFVVRAFVKMRSAFHDGREQAADPTNNCRPNDSPDQQLRREIRSEGDLAEALPVHRRRVKPIENEVSDSTSEQAADQGKHERFEHDGGHDRTAAEPERPQGGYLARPRRD